MDDTEKRISERRLKLKQRQKLRRQRYREAKEREERELAAHRASRRPFYAFKGHFVARFRQRSNWQGSVFFPREWIVKFEACGPLVAVQKADALSDMLDNYLVRCGSSVFAHGERFGTGVPDRKTLVQMLIP